MRGGQQGQGTIIEEGALGNPPRSPVQRKYALSSAEEDRLDLKPVLINQVVLHKLVSLQI